MHSKLQIHVAALLDQALCYDLVTLVAVKAVTLGHGV